MMPKSKNVIPIRPDIRASAADRAVEDLAYQLWLERAFRGGSPEEDLLTALQMLRGRKSAVLFLVPARQSSLPPFVSLKCHLMRAGS
jgi:hypothetical protein